MERSKQTGLFGRTLPRQHGAWATLVACFLLGPLVTGRFEPRLALLLAAVLAAFFAREAAALWLRLPPGGSYRKRVLGWLALYAIIFAGAGLPLAWLCGGAVLPLLAMVAALLLALSLAFARNRREERGLGAELLGILGLCLIAPAGEYVAAGSWSGRTTGIGLLCLLFFAGSVFHVRYLTRRRRERAAGAWPRLRAGAAPLAYHLLALALAALLSRAPGGHWLAPPLAPLALVPMAFKSLASVLRGPRGPVAIKTIGVQEVFHTAAFVALVAVAFHYAPGAAGG